LTLVLRQPDVNDLLAFFAFLLKNTLINHILKVPICCRLTNITKFLILFICNLTLFFEISDSFYLTAAFYRTEAWAFPKKHKKLMILLILLFRFVLRKLGPFRKNAKNKIKGFLQTEFREFFTF